MRCKVLGPLEVVTEDNTLIPMASVEQRRLMSVLAFRIGTISSTDFLAHHLVLSAGAVRTSVSRLRRQLGADVLLTGPQGYVLHRVVCDAGQFETQLAEVSMLSDPAEIRAGLTAALALWRGEPYGEFALEEWSSGESVRLTELQTEAVERLVDLLLDVGDHSAAIVRLEGHIAAHPFRDRPRGQHMRALVLCGRRVEALRVFQRYRRFLADEIGIGPSPALIALDRAIAADGSNHHDAGAGDERVDASGVVAVASLPAGVVTFVACDIVPLFGTAGSHLPAGSDALNQLMQQHGGFVLPCGTPACVAAFADPIAAVAAAIDAVVGSVGLLGGNDVTRAVPMTTRLAVHTGMAIARNGDYSGPTLRTSIALLSAANPNQILLSSPSRSIIREHIFRPDVTVRPRGVHVIQDIIAPIEIFDVAIDGIDGNEAPLRNSAEPHPTDRNLPFGSNGSGAALERRSRLPEVRNPLVGREDAVLEIRRLLKRHRVVMLTGPGGIGKTALALEIAGRESADRQESVFFVDLGAVGPGDDVSIPFFRALGLQRNGSGHPTSQLADALAARAALLLVDNCEQVLDPVAEVVMALGRCQGLRVLATSREALAIPGECVWRVAGLPVRPTAMRLFEDRALEADSSFRTGPQDAALIADICRRLDGIPLAIELAASRVRSLSLADICDGLDGQLRTLAAPRRGVASRQRSLEAVIAWSYDLLSEPDQWLLRQLAVFPDGFTSDDVCGITTWKQDAVVDVIDALVAKSLVEMVRPGGVRSGSADARVRTRYRLLESLRAFALDRLVRAGEHPAAQDRHLEHFLTTEGADPELRIEHVLPRVYIRDFPNLRVAANRAIETDRLVDATRLTIGRSVALLEFGVAREGLDWLAGRTELSISDQLWALNGCAYLAMALGDCEGARAYMQESLALAGGEPFDAMPNAFSFAAINDLLRDDDRALHLINQAIELVPSTPSGVLHLPLVHHVRALVHLHARRWDAAVDDALAVQRHAPATSPYGGTSIVTYLVAQTVRADHDAFATALGAVRRSTRVGAHEWNYRLFDLLSADVASPDADAAAQLAQDAVAPNSGPTAQRCADLLAVLLWRSYLRGAGPADDAFTASSISTSPFGALAMEAAGMSRGWSGDSWLAERMTLGALAQTSESAAMAVRSVWALTERDVADAILGSTPSARTKETTRTVLR